MAILALPKHHEAADRLTPECGLPLGPHNGDVRQPCMFTTSSNSYQPGWLTCIEVWPTFDLSMLGT